VRGQHHLALGPADEAASEDPFVGLVGSARSLGDRRQLTLVLSAAKPFHQPSCRDQFDPFGHTLPEPPQVLDARLRVVIANPTAQPARRVADQAPLHPKQVEALDLPLGALGVAEVCQEEPFLGSHHRQPARSREPGQPPEIGPRLPRRLARVDEVTDQQLVESFVREKGGEAVAARSRAHDSSSRFRIWSASR
jgi:hypothetical protein